MDECRLIVQERTHLLCILINLQQLWVHGRDKRKCDDRRALSVHIEMLRDGHELGPPVSSAAPGQVIPHAGLDTHKARVDEIGKVLLTELFDLVQHIGAERMGRAKRLSLMPADGSAPCVEHLREGHKVAVMCLEGRAAAACLAAHAFQERRLGIQHCCNR